MRNKNNETLNMDFVLVPARSKSYNVIHKVYDLCVSKNTQNKYSKLMITINQKYPKSEFIADFAKFGGKRYDILVNKESTVLQLCFHHAGSRVIPQKRKGKYMITAKELSELIDTDDNEKVFFDFFCEEGNKLFFKISSENVKTSVAENNNVAESDAVSELLDCLIDDPVSIDTEKEEVSVETIEKTPIKTKKRGRKPSVYYILDNISK